MLLSFYLRSIPEYNISVNNSQNTNFVAIIFCCSLRKGDKKRKKTGYVRIAEIDSTGRYVSQSKHYDHVGQNKIQTENQYKSIESRSFLGYICNMLSQSVMLQMSHCRRVREISNQCSESYFVLFYFSDFSPIQLARPTLVTPPNPPPGAPTTSQYPATVNPFETHHPSASQQSLNPSIAS